MEIKNIYNEKIIKYISRTQLKHYLNDCLKKFYNIKLKINKLSNNMT